MYMESFPTCDRSSNYRHQSDSCYQLTVTDMTVYVADQFDDVRLLLLLSFAFRDLKFCLSSQSKAASCARCSSKMPPSKQVNGHSFNHNMPHCLVFTAVAEWRGDVTPLMLAVATWSRVRSESV